MKLKEKFAKKLVFQKSTVANLNEIELKKIYGGVSLTVCRTEGITNCKACGSKFGGC
jgi:hypothetical protein